MEHILRALIERLASRGMALNTIPAFIRRLGQTLASSPGMSLEDLNRMPRLKGCEEFELDEATLCLILAAFQYDDAGNASRAAGSHRAPMGCGSPQTGSFLASAL